MKFINRYLKTKRLCSYYEQVADFIKEQMRADTEILYIDDLHYDIRAEYIEIVVLKNVR